MGHSEPFARRKLTEPAGRFRWLTQAEAAALIHAAVRVSKASHLRDFISMGLYAGWVFCNRNGERMASIKRGFAAVVRLAGLHNVHPHDLRRTFGSWLVQADVPIQPVFALLRHSDIRVTDRVYAHLSPDSFRKAAAILDRRVVSRSDFTLPETAVDISKSSL